MTRIQYIHTYEHIISLENILNAWNEFRKGKTKRKDVLEFERNLMSECINLHIDLSNMQYKHSRYHAFTIADPKPRNIHKALVRDRLLHHALYRELYPFFDHIYIAHSYSCRRYKGTHKALNCFRSFSNSVSKNRTRTVWVLKCDIRKFFASVDHAILFDILKKYITDSNILSVLSEIIGSFNSGIQGKGLPLGNLTSQLLVNIYMNEFDQFVKHTLKAKHYIRYADDFVFLSDDKQWLGNILPQVAAFLNEKLKLSLHPNKVFIKTLASGVDFLGWVHFGDHCVVRTKTKRRMFRQIMRVKGNRGTVQSYLGLLLHGNAKNISLFVKTLYSC